MWLDGEWFDQPHELDSLWRCRFASEMQSREFVREALHHYVQTAAENARLIEELEALRKREFDPKAMLAL